MPLPARFLTGVLINAAVCGACHNPGSTAAPAAPVAATIQAGVLALSADEARVRDSVRAHHDEDIMLLERAVNLRDSMGMIRVAGKTNIIAPKAVVNGDLRFLRESPKDSARARMRAHNHLS